MLNHFYNCLSANLSEENEEIPVVCYLIYEKSSWEAWQNAFNVKYIFVLYIIVDMWYSQSLRD